METTCIMCPMGCALTVTENNGIVKVSGNTCPRGEKYGMQEFTAPKRMVTTLLKVQDGGVVSVKTSNVAPKEKVQDILHAAAQIIVSAPINAGDVLVKDVAGSGVDFIATADYRRK